MSIPSLPTLPRRLFIACLLLLGVAVAAVWLEARAPGVLPLVAVAGCLVFHWFGHGGHSSAGPADTTEHR